MTAFRTIWPATLLGLYPLLVLLSANLEGEAIARTISLGLACALGVACLGLWFGRRQRISESQQTVLVALLALSFFYPGVALGTHNFGRPQDMALFLSAWVGATGLLALATMRLPRLAVAATFTRVFALVLIVGPTLVIARFGIRTLTTSPSASYGPASRAHQTNPDIYLVLLDKYTSSEVLRQQYGFNNSAFEQALRDRGLIVPANARANYVHTFLSLASLLNWTYLDSLTDTYGSSTRNYEPAYRMVRHNRLVSMARAKGYEVIFFESGYPLIREMQDVDINVALSTRHAGLLPLYWQRTLPALIWRFVCTDADCLLRPSVPFDGDSPRIVLEKLDSIANLASRPGSQLVIAHLLLPHEPYIFDSQCSHRDYYWPMADTGSWRTAYVGQVQCTNRLLLALVDRLLAAPGSEPVILVQSDHGHGGIALDALTGRTTPLDRLDAAAIQDRISVFGAYHLPGLGISASIDSLTLINLLPMVLNEYLGAAIPLQDDRIYWSDFTRPYAFTRIDGTPVGSQAADSTP